VAEVAFVVRDDYQHHGLGHLLLEKLAEAAWARGVTDFNAVTLLENRKMTAVFMHSGFPVATTFEGEELSVSFPIDPAGHGVSRSPQDSPKEL
jgi:GNAT superfamily N-acetyltransferase